MYFATFPSLFTFSLFAVSLFLAESQIAIGQNRSPFDANPINYDTAPVNDRVFQLQKDLDDGKKKLTYDRKHGYLPSLLKHLKIPISSQALVFSKTSFQRPLISREKPRAIYFTDDIYVGWVQDGDVIEISAVDPDLGAIFYTIEQNKVEEPEFERRIESCMLCHSSSVGARVPGHLVRSIHPNSSGLPLPGSSSYRTSHISPFEKRWGGWYVSGTHGDQSHMGNHFFRTKQDLNKPLPATGQNVTDLKKLFATSPYLSGHSDIVALLVLEHQVRMHNLMTAANYETKRALADEELAKGEKDENDRDKKLSAVTKLRINKAAERVVEYMLFCDEHELTSNVKGTTQFESEFSKRGPRDQKGRSLRDFDLNKRIFRYPCSYLIYSQAFNGLPQVLKKQIVNRLTEILSGADKGNRFQHISTKDKRAILEILRDTHENFSPDN